MGQAPGGTPGPKRWGRQGEQVSLSTFRQRVGLRSEGRLIFPSSDLRVAGGARKDPEAAVTLNRADLMARWPERERRPGRDTALPRVA